MTALRHFRITALLEGWSYLVLLFVAMPLKYAAGLPLAVRIAGSLHGFLFLVFIAALYRACVARNWPLRRAFRAFVFDRSLRRELGSEKVAPTISA